MVEPGEPHAVADKTLVEDASSGIDLGTRAETVHRGREDERVGATPVIGDELAVTGHSVVDHPQARLSSPDRVEGARDDVFVRGRALARRRRHDEDRGRLVAAVPVGVDYACSCLVTRLARKREIEAQALRHLPGRHAARQEQDEPRDDHDAPVAEHEPGQAAEDGARPGRGDRSR